MRGASLRGWLNAVQSTPTYQRLQGLTGAAGYGWARPSMVNYLLSKHELWARSYSQYIAVKSQDPQALAELRKLQTQSASTHGYPTQWSDEEFKPIEAAFDALFEALGWRGKKGKS